MKPVASPLPPFHSLVPKAPKLQGKWSQKPQCYMPNPIDAIYPATYEVSGLNARATPVTKKAAPNRYMGHSQPSGSGFSPGLTPQSHPVGGSNCDSPWPPCRRVVMERLRAEARGLRAHRTARSGATVCRRMAISGACRRGEALACGDSSGSGVSGPQWLVEVGFGERDVVWTKPAVQSAALLLVRTPDSGFQSHMTENVTDLRLSMLWR